MPDAVRGARSLHGIIAVSHQPRLVCLVMNGTYLLLCDLARTVFRMWHGLLGYRV